MLRRIRPILRFRPRTIASSLSITRRWRAVGLCPKYARGFRTSWNRREENTTQSDCEVDNAKAAPPQWTLDRQATDRQLKDIVTDDLAATLKAHKLSNEKTRFRWVARDNENEVSAIGSLIPKQETHSDAAISALEQDLRITEDAVLETQDNQNKQWRYTRWRNGKEVKREPGYVAPRRYGEPDHMPFWPLKDHEISDQLSLQAQLSRDVYNLSRWLQLSSREARYRRLLAHDLIESLPKVVKDTKLSLMGSLVTGLGDVTSDVDIALIIPSMEAKRGRRGPSQGLGRPDNRALVKKKLIHVSKELRYRGFSGLNIIMARYPLLQATHTASNVKIQIVVSQPTKSQEELIKSYLEDYSHLKDVYLVLKAALAARGLNEPSLGGLGSYSLFMLIVTALVHTKTPRKADQMTYLKNVVHFCATMSTEKYCFTVDSLKLFTKMLPGSAVKAKARQGIMAEPTLTAMQKLQYADPNLPWLLTLQDPDDADNDLGRHTNRWRDIQKTLQVLDDHLQRTLEGENVSSSTRPDAPALSFLFGYTLGIYRDARDSFREWMTAGAGNSDIRRLAGRHNDFKKPPPPKQIAKGNTYTELDSYGGIGDTAEPA